MGISKEAYTKELQNRETVFVTRQTTIYEMCDEETYK